LTIFARHWYKFFLPRIVSESTLISLNCLKCRRLCLARYTGRENITVVYEMREDKSAWQLAVTRDPVHTTFRISLSLLVFARSFRSFAKKGVVFLSFFSRFCLSVTQIQKTLKRNFFSSASFYVSRQTLIHFCNCGIHRCESVLLV